MRIPLFPLNTVLFPEGPLPLRIFESRYIDMVSACMKSGSPFGVVLIKDGAEVGPSATWEVGSLANIADFYQGSDGLLGITAVGGQRFRLLASETQADGLKIGKIELIEPEATLALPEKYRHLSSMLSHVLDELGRLYEAQERRYDDAVWVSYRFLEILPIDVSEKQRSLESSDTLARLELVDSLLESVRTTTPG